MTEALLALPQQDKLLANASLGQIEAKLRFAELLTRLESRLPENISGLMVTGVTTISPETTDVDEAEKKDSDPPECNTLAHNPDEGVLNTSIQKRPAPRSSQASSAAISSGIIKQLPTVPPVLRRSILPSVHVGALSQAGPRLVELWEDDQFRQGLSAAEQEYASALTSAKDPAAFSEAIPGLAVGDTQFEQFAYGLVNKIRLFKRSGSTPAIPGPRQPAVSKPSLAKPATAAELDTFFETKIEVEAVPWQEQALCAQTDPDAFFPEKGGSTREAKRVCGKCDVREDCLRYALDHDERFGIWGGFSERERRRLKRRAV